MKRPSLRKIAFAALAAGALMASSSAHAIFRAYLSGTGVDTNPCTLVAPCRLLDAALVAVDVGGEIWMMDSANFNSGPIAITKSVTILAIPGQLGSVVGIGGDALQIATASVNVTLQNLNIRWLSGTGHGINITNGAKVTIVNCNIFNFAGANQTGIRVNTGTNATNVIVTHSIVRNNWEGFWASGNSNSTISDSRFIANTGRVGINAYSSDAATTTVVNVSNSVMSGNAYGVASVSNCATCATNVYLTQSVVSDNNPNYGLYQYGAAGIFYSRGDNSVRNNGANTIGTISPYTGT